MRTIISILFVALLVACAGPAEPTPEEVPEVLAEAAEGVDVDNDGDVDIALVDDEIVVEMEDVVDEEVLEAIEDVPEEYCIPGSTFEYAGEDGTVDSEVIGLTTFKGEERCQAESITVIPSQIGDITTDTTYYYTQEFNDFWIVATVSGPMPAQTTEIHIVDGEIQ